MKLFLNIGWTLPENLPSPQLMDRLPKHCRSNLVIARGGTYETFFITKRPGCGGFYDIKVRRGWPCIGYLIGWHVTKFVIPILGGLSLHLNHLIASRAANYDWPFGTLPFGLFGSNLNTRDL